MPGGSIEVRAVGADDEIRSLRTWLTGEDELRGRVRLLEEPLKAGQMGGIADAVTVAISTGGLATVTVQSVFAWLRQRERGHSAKLTLQDDSGRQAHLVIDGVRDSEQVIEKVRDFFSNK